jgi:hypothetical protein
MESENMVEEDASGVGCRCCSFGGSKMNHLGESVDENHNGIIPSPGFRQLDNEVHGDLLPRSTRRWQGVEQPSRGLLAGLDALTGVAGLDIIADHPIHLGPIEETMKSLVSAFNALVPRDRDVMVIMEDLGAERTTGNA